MVCCTDQALECQENTGDVGADWVRGRNRLGNGQAVTHQGVDGGDVGNADVTRDAALTVAGWNAARCWAPPAENKILRLRRHDAANPDWGVVKENGTLQVFNCVAAYGALDFAFAQQKLQLGKAGGLSLIHI